MKRLLLSLSIVIGVWMLSPTPEASAGDWSSWWDDGGSSWWDDVQSAWSSRWNDGGDHVRQHHDGGGFATPELDPSAAGSAMVLLLGGVAYIASRRREDDPGF